MDSKENIISGVSFCVTCAVPFQPKLGRSGLYCSKRCYSLKRDSRVKNMGKIYRLVCKKCFLLFPSKSRIVRYCESCRILLRKEQSCY